MEFLVEWARGEPVAFGAFVSAMLGAIGVFIAPNEVAQIVIAITPLIVAIKTRKHTTPAADPAIPHAHVDTRTDAPKPTPQRIRSFSLATRLSDLGNSPIR